AKVSDIHTARRIDAAVTPRRDADDPGRDAVVAPQRRTLFTEQRHKPACDVAEPYENEIERHCDSVDSACVAEPPLVSCVDEPSWAVSGFSPTISFSSSSSLFSPFRRYSTSSPKPIRR